jgi:hypothetical protein
MDHVVTGEEQFVRALLTLNPPSGPDDELVTAAQAYADAASRWLDLARSLTRPVPEAVRCSI